VSRGAVRALPVPAPKDELKAQFWEHCAQEKLCFQRCRACGVWRHLPRYLCAKCHSAEWEWAESCGRAVIFSWTITHRPMHPAFTPDIPFAAVIVELDEGIRMVSGVRGIANDELALDLPVEVVFERVSDDMSLPFFRPRS
jgi:uncharacterized OB-fold protein